MSTIERPKSPPLEAGQHLDRATFHARYEAMAPDTWAELIGGVVHMGTRVSRRHGSLVSLLVYWLVHFQRTTRGVEALRNVTVLLDDRAEPQPDGLMRIIPECGGQSRDEGDSLGGAPELIIEVAQGTSRRIDLGPKFADYERAGVREYVVVALDPDEASWFVRRGDRLVPVPPGPDGSFRSEVFPGLWLDPQSFYADDMDRLVATLDRGLATPEHADFVARLAAARRADRD